MTAKNDATQKPRAKTPRRKARPKKEQKVTEAKEAAPETAPLHQPLPEPATAADTAGTTAAETPTRAKPATPRRGATTGLTMATMAEGYLAHLADAGKGKGTQFSYSIDLDIAIKHFGPETAVASLTERKVTNFFESDAVCKTRNGRPKAAPTIAKTIRVLRQALLWAAEAGHIETAPAPAKAKRARKGEDAGA